MNVLRTEMQAAILTDVMERKSIRGVARSVRGNTTTGMKKISPTTVMKLIADGGDAAIDFLDAKMRLLPSKFIEIDEAYCIVGMHPRTARRLKLNIDGIGAMWLWVAIDARSKLVVSWHLGNRKAADCDLFIKDLHSRLAERVQITSDHLPRYPAAIEAAFGDNVDYARVKFSSSLEEDKRLEMELAGKYYKPPKLTPLQVIERKEENRPVRVIGNPDLDPTVATTNHIEAFWTRLRNDIGRMTRRSGLISKKAVYLRRVLALYFFHHNFIKRHWAHQNTPAIAAGIEDDVWTWDDFVPFISEFRARQPNVQKRRLEKVAAAVEHDNVIHLPDQSGIIPDSPFCVFQSRLGEGYVKIHKSTCKHLRVGIGKQATKGVDRKLYCDTIEDAQAKAAELNVANTAVCKICLGQIRTLGYKDSRRPKTRR